MQGGHRNTAIRGDRPRPHPSRHCVAIHLPQRGRLLADAGAGQAAQRRHYGFCPPTNYNSILHSPLLTLNSPIILPLPKGKEDTLTNVLDEIRRRPTLPGRFQPSTISVLRLNFCVRDGNRWIPQAIVTGNWAGPKPFAAVLPSLASRHSYCLPASYQRFRSGL